MWQQFLNPTVRMGGQASEHVFQVGVGVVVAESPEHAELLMRWREYLYAELNPEVVDVAAKARQRELIEFYGGEDAIRSGAGIGGYTPAPEG